MILQKTSLQSIMWWHSFNGLWVTTGKLTNKLMYGFLQSLKDWSPQMIFKSDDVEMPTCVRQRIWDSSSHSTYTQYR